MWWKLFLLFPPLTFGSLGHRYLDRDTQDVLNRRWHLSPSFRVDPRLQDEGPMAFHGMSGCINLSLGEFLWKLRSGNQANSKYIFTHPSLGRTIRDYLGAGTGHRLGSRQKAHLHLAAPFNRLQFHLQAMLHDYTPSTRLWLSLSPVTVSSIDTLIRSTEVN